MESDDSSNELLTVAQKVLAEDSVPAHARLDVMARLLQSQMTAPALSWHARERDELLASLREAR